jgi:hypothetical protein
MTVEIKVIPIGVSGIKKKYIKKEKRKALPGERKPKTQYERRVKKTASRMELENKQETQRYTPRRIRAILRDTIKAGSPDLTLDELNDLVDQMLPRAMESYRGKGLLVAEPSAEVKAVWAARKAERRRVVNANKIRRKSRGEND